MVRSRWRQLLGLKPFSTSPFAFGFGMAAAAQQQQQQQGQPILVQDLALVNHVSTTLNISPQNATKLLSILPNVKQMIPTLETEQGAELKRQLQEVGKIVQNYHTNMRLAKEQQHREAYYAALARNAAAQQQQVQVTGTGPSLAVPVPIQSAIHDPEEITRSQSTAPAAHVDPGPASWPPIRPTLNGGFPAGLQHGTPSSIQPPADDPSIFVPDIRPTSLRKNQGAEQHVRKKIQELVATVDANVKVDAEAEDVRTTISSSSSIEKDMGYGS
ncbi:Transcription initiation factor TFIID subunit 12 [Serendipita sp. 400]|nr:Transcription initiation factor TFIID subunit 12 [Serendipita sp. 400]